MDNIEKYIGIFLNNFNEGSISELSEETFWTFIKSEEFHKIPTAINLFSEIKRQSPFDRIISILGHIVELHPIAIIYFKSFEIINTKILDIEYGEPKSKERDNELATLIGYKGNCNSFLFDYYDELSMELKSSSSVFRSINLLKSVEYLIESNSSVINQNNDCFMLSPMFFPFDQWSQLAIRELSLLESHNLFESYIIKFVTLLDDLAKRIGHSSAPSLKSSIYNISENGDLSYKLDFNAYMGIEGYNLEISKYVGFLESIEFEDVRETNLEILGKKIIEEERRKEKILQKIKNSKIKIFKNTNHLKKGLKYLLKKKNPKVDLTILEKVSSLVISELFHYKSKNEPFKIPEGIEFNNQLLLEYVIFLEKYQYTKYNSKVSVPKVISQNCTLPMKGLTQSNLYNILKSKISYHPDNIANIKLPFLGLTSELALLNEMNN